MISSALFYDGSTSKVVERPGKDGSPNDIAIEGLSLFKKGVEPKWEDPANSSGGEWSCRQGKMKL